MNGTSPRAEQGGLWLPRALFIHMQAAAGMAAVLCTASLVVGPFGAETSLSLLLAGIVLVGMPHGAFDPILAEPHLRRRFGARWQGWFALLYFAPAGMVLLGWVFAPVATLIGFIALSVYHFGIGDIEDGLVPDRVPKPVAIFTRGLLPILMPAALWPKAVLPVLAGLASLPPAKAAPAFATATHLLILPWLGGLCWLLAASLRERVFARTQGFELLTLIAVFVLLPPLLGFAVYFCLCHAIRHLLRLGAWHAPDDGYQAARWLVRVIIPSACLTAIGILALWLVIGGSEMLLVPLFRLIAALTLPHMIVTGLMLGPKEATARALPQPAPPPAPVSMTSPR